jgi:hypothetical protein
LLLGINPDRGCTEAHSSIPRIHTAVTTPGDGPGDHTSTEPSPNSP